jgi:hypothetical protein
MHPRPGMISRHGKQPGFERIVAQGTRHVDTLLVWDSPQPLAARSSGLFRL